MPGHIPGGGVGWNNFIMQESRLEENGGQRYLVCWYDTERCNWDDVIKRALLKHKIDGKVPVLCLPAKSEAS